jgi:hypothetical protein
MVRAEQCSRLREYRSEEWNETSLERVVLNRIPTNNYFEARPQLVSSPQSILILVILVKLNSISPHYKTEILLTKARSQPELRSSLISCLSLSSTTTAAGAATYHCLPCHGRPCRICLCHCLRRCPSPSQCHEWSLPLRHCGPYCARPRGGVQAPPLPLAAAPARSASLAEAATHCSESLPARNQAA